MTARTETARRTAVRRILVRHLSWTALITAPIEQRLAAILDDLTDAGILPPAPPRRERAQPRTGGLVTGWGAKVTAARHDRGWTVRALAAQAEVSVQTLQRIEHDQPVRLPKLVAVLTALDLTPET